jgi:dihydroneopterin triphosphate diphosphatase
VNYKLPVSVLVVVHTLRLEVLLLERASRPGFWQSVTGSLDWPDESFAAAASREVHEETGIAPGRGELHSWKASNTFEIYAHWRHRFAPGVLYNTEHVFGLALRAPVPVTLAEDEHVAFAWVPWREAAQRCFSWSNRDAIRLLAERAAGVIS